MASVRVGVIGCGWIGHTTHIPVFAQNPKATLMALCDADEGLLQKIGGKYGIQNRFRNYAELIDSKLVDTVSICTPTYSKIAALEAEIHVLCEKPLASNLQEADAVTAAVRNSKAHFMIGFNYRFLPNHVKARDLVRSGKIGDSGDLQEETTVPSIRKTVLILRTSTERPEAVDAGFAQVVGVNKEAIEKATREIWKRPPDVPYASPFGDGEAAERIASLVIENLE